MAPQRVVFIRHAEEHGAPGVTEAGEPDKHSLTVRGWQRAGALARRLAPADGACDFDAVFASRVGENSATRRPQQTVAPLLALKPRLIADMSYLKTEVEAMMEAVLAQSGTVLVAWEHSMIPKCLAQIPEGPRAPDEWPQDRYDLFWDLERTGEKWSFAQRSQLLLAGDT